MHDVMAVRLFNIDKHLNEIILFTFCALVHHCKRIQVRNGPTKNKCRTNSERSQNKHVYCIIL